MAKNKKNETKVVCPVCGAEFAIPENSQLVTGIAIGKDSGLGVAQLPLANHGCETPASTFQAGKFASIPARLAERISTMESKGISTADFFSIQNAKGEGTLMKWKDGVPMPVTEDELDEILKDAVANEIYGNGYIKNTKLHRRWIMAHVFRMLDNPKGFNADLRAHGYDYMWKMMTEEFRVQSILFKSDTECAVERNTLFPFEVALDVIDNDIKATEAYIVDLVKNHTKKCKGVPYITVNGKNVFVSDVEKRIMSPLRTLRAKVKTSMGKDSITASKAIYDALHYYCGFRVRLKNAEMTHKFVDAYKAAGAYYTCKNLIQFHGCQVKNGAVWQTTAKSLATLDKKMHEYEGEGWRLFAFMKKMIDDNKFDFKARMQQLYRK